MAGNTFGKLLIIITFGESHGNSIGVVIDGFPAGLKIDFSKIANDLQRRKPGQSNITTQRNESEEFEVLSGLFNETTLGSPIAVVIKNKDQKSEDYKKLKDVYRPSHADFTYDAKYGIRDYRGGGRSSARETVARVIAGSFAKQLLEKENVMIAAYVSQVGDVKLTQNYGQLDLTNTESNVVRCPDTETAEKMISLIENVRSKGDSVGGVISCVIKNCPIGLGEPVFDKLHADLGKAMLSINAVKGFEIGEGFAAASMFGSEHNDAFEITDNKTKTTTNHSGGIQGGISNGMDIFFSVAFKPVATISQKQQTINSLGEDVSLEAKGRHDPCVVPRAVPIVEAMAALVLADHLLRNKVSRV
jgi:chorismate synthase